MPIDRRRFLRLIIGIATGILTLANLQERLLPEVGALTNLPTLGITRNPSGRRLVSEPNAVRVVIVRGSASIDPQDYVEKALEALGGVEGLVPAGANILIKPNVGFYDNDATTDPRVTAAVVKALKRTQPAKIVVGESALRGVDVDYAFRVTRTRSLAEAAGAEVRDLRKDETVSVEVPNGLALRSVDVFRTARDSIIVSVPRLKRHSSTTATISLKNLMGIIPDDQKGRFHEINLNQCIADLCLALHPKLAIIDATRAMTKRGPSGGVMVNLNMIVASTDPVAADLIAAEELFKAEGAADPHAAAALIDHIQNTAQVGVGTTDPSKIEVVNVSLS
jgi:uncharacterized protein (DUF362 family)